MPITWISVSTKWSITSVQAALNVIISVVGTIGVWAVSRYWWQRGSQHILRGKSEVPLSALLNVADPAEGYETIRLLRRRVFAKEYWRLLFQILIVLLATLACMFAGPIAKVSLRLARVPQREYLKVLKATKGTGFIGNRLDANVEWNDTMKSLDDAKFPYDQLLDYLPPATEPWIYVAREWDVTWSAACDYHDETLLHNVSATGNGTIMQPLEAFPEYRDTYHPRWLDTSKFRIQADSNAEQVYTKERGMLYKDALFWILIQSEPTIDDRMNTNNATLELSMSSLHLQNFYMSPDDKDATQASLETWRPLGPVENASFTRLECNFTRKPVVPDEDAIPWIWTNDTWSITFAYRSNWMTEVGKLSSKNLTVTTPTPQKLFRFYQAYMISVNSWLAYPSERRVSVWMDTVQISTAILVVLIILVLLELWIVGRYVWFLRRYKQPLEKLGIPDGRLEWMIHAAKLAAQGPEEDTDTKESITAEGNGPLKDRDYFHQASFGNVPDSEIARPQLARVYTSNSRMSIPTCTQGDIMSRSRSREVRSKYLPHILFRPTKAVGINGNKLENVVDDRDIQKDGQCPEHIARSSNSAPPDPIDSEISSSHVAVRVDSRDRSPHSDKNMLNLTPWKTSSKDKSRASSENGEFFSRSSIHSIVPEEDEIAPIDRDTSEGCT